MYCRVCKYGGEKKVVDDEMVCPRCGATGGSLVDIPAMAQGPLYPTDDLDLRRDLEGYTNPNLHRRAQLHTEGNPETIDYPDSVEVSIRDFTAKVINDINTVTKYIGEPKYIKMPSFFVDAGFITLGEGMFTESDVIFVDLPDGMKTIE